jgi:tRNA 2-thiouridine synthesizing protein D
LKSEDEPIMRLTFAIMDPPFESARSTTFFRLLAIAAERGYEVGVFAYEGGVHLAFERQSPHGNGVHQTTAESENHPLPKDWLRELMELAKARGGRIDWVNCGLCVDERGVYEAVAGVRRGSPQDFWKMVVSSDNVLTIGTRG